MSGNTAWDVVVVGSGPNGLAAAITMAQAGRSVLVLEAEDEIGGATRSAPLVGEGYINDLGSAIHPLGKASPFFSSLDLEAHGLRWITPPAAVAHPLDGGRAAIAWNDLDATVDGLGADGAAYRRLYEPYIRRLDDLLDLALGPVLRIPRRPLFAAAFGLKAAQPAAMFARRTFNTDEGRSLFAGHAGHSILPLSRPLTSSFGLLFGATVHTVGWPFPEGGAEKIPAALASVLRELGGELRTGVRVRRLQDLPTARQVIFDLTPLQVLRIAGEALTPSYRKTLAGFRYGPSVFKIDYALREPIPWANPDVARAATVHVGGTLRQVAASEAAVQKGRVAQRPFLILAQHSLFDATRAPEGRHTCWVYCHVPNGYAGDATHAIESQIERFAPGFRDVIEQRVTSAPADLLAWNANLIGGDIGGGSVAGTQLVLRPGLRLNPYATSDRRLFIGSASTPPGAGVHGMGGYHAATTALRRSR